ncbi:hypothetical protein [Pseudolactococcus insecticola]|uniref:Uncharacterized protein n=1 Tax=Pseudolactococcus insecticola TaxID=2709158 RepID=A0A6A0B7E0_9LACT|nr:hypothetical protein [Lactococcus insecticola]GFH40675.1 hypothetical protein Hs20B_10730 [Lactococcus insecticola]
MVNTKYQSGQDFKTQQESLKQKKQAMIEQAKKRQKITDQPATNTINKKSQNTQRLQQKYQKRLTELEKSLKLSQTALVKANEKTEQAKAEKVILAKSVSDLNIRLTNQIEDYKKLERQNKIHRDQVDKLLTALGLSAAEFDQAIEKFQYYRDESSYQHKEFLRLERVEGILEQEIEKRNVQIGSLNRKILKRDKEIRKLNHKLQDKHQAEKAHVEEQIQRINLGDFSVSELLKHLENRLKTDDISQFDTINDLLVRYDRRIRKLTQDSNYQYGYAHETDNGWEFHDVQQRNSFPMPVNPNVPFFERLKDGDTVKVKVSSDGGEKVAELVFLMASLSERRKKSRNIYRKKLTKRQDTGIGNQPERFLSGDVAKIAKTVSVLLITAKNGKRYLEELTPFMKSVALMDPYEKYEKEIFSAIKSHDIVIIGTEGTPHAITDYVKNNFQNDDRIQLMYQPSRGDIFARIHWLLINENFSQE